MKGRLDLERHSGRTPEGVIIRIPRCFLALPAASWHDHTGGQAAPRSRTAYDH
ncbi:hypothetical protein [Streptosporangium sp. CA-115845]|uniref:hypothetical protein n=1 Tax=Streptosporangium sp. CA-115845 TaxID=3240071 RepID=UPI003D912657